MRNATSSNLNSLNVFNYPFGYAILIATLLLGSFWGTAYAQKVGDELPSFDIRHEAASSNVNNLVATDPVLDGRDAAASLLKSQVNGLSISFDASLDTPSFIRSTTQFLTDENSQKNWLTILADYVDAHEALFMVDSSAVLKCTVTRDYVSKHNGVRHVTLQQMLNGMEIAGAELRANFSRDNAIINISSTLVASPGSTATHKKGSLLSAREALLAAAGNIGTTLNLSNDIPAKDGVWSVFDSSTKSTRALKARRAYFPLSRTEVVPVWITEVSDGTNLYESFVDANSSQTLLRWNRVKYAATESADYNVYTSDSPSPFSPGSATPDGFQPPTVGRTLQSLISWDPVASPDGWIPDGENELKGNNADVYIDGNNDGDPDLPRTQGNPYRVFSFPLDLGLEPQNYVDASLTQLFYQINFLHDRLYALGFDEVSGNFQEDNFGRGGIEGDGVLAEVQIFGGSDGGHFTVPTDGYNPELLTFVFTDPTPDRDVSLDSEMVTHEYVHGLSSRLLGGIWFEASVGLEEGWSDFYALSLLSEGGDDPHGNYAFGAYSAYQLNSLVDNYYFGLRRYPYSTDHAINPLTFADTDPTQISLPDPATVPFTTNYLVDFPGVAVEPHNLGEVWCVMLWGCRANLIDKYGIIGNEMMLQLVTDGMKLSPGNPNFTEARDAILEADLINNGGENLPELWAGFADRGLGFGAHSPHPTTTMGTEESFELPSFDDLQITPWGDFTTKGPYGGPFVPYSLTYTFRNNGDKLLNWTASVSEAWLTLGTPTSGDLLPGESTTITLSLDTPSETMALGTYNDVFVVTNNQSGEVQTRDVTFRVREPLVMEDEQFIAKGNEGGPFNPNSKTYTLTNEGGASIDWSAQVLETWVEVLAPTSGTLAPGASTTIIVELTSNASSQPIGLHIDELVINNVTLNSSQSRDIALDVNSDGRSTVYYFGMGYDPGWTTEGAWEWGEPQGGESNGCFDPTVGWLHPLNELPGTNVYGYNLGGPFDEGDYTNNLLPQRLTTNVLDFTKNKNVHLSFQRWLGIEYADYDEASIEVSNDGENWTTVWEHTGSIICEQSWGPVTYDISDVADHQPTVWVRWVMGHTDESITYPGWNIDEVHFSANIELSISNKNTWYILGCEGEVYDPEVPECRTYTVENIYEETIDWYANSHTNPRYDYDPYVYPPDFLDITPNSGTLAPGESIEVEACVTAVANTLEIDWYNAHLHFGISGSGGTIIRNVHLDVLADPEPPENTFPPDGEIDVPVETQLSWSIPAVDEHFDHHECPIAFDVYLDTVDPPLELIAEDIPYVDGVLNYTLPIGPLEREVTYYWYVVAKNCCADTEGPIWSFNTIPIPGEILVLDSTAPQADLLVEFDPIVAQEPKFETIWIQNTSEEHDLIITGIVGSTSPAFIVTGPNVPYTIPPGAIVAHGVEFNPDSPGEHEGQMTIIAIDDDEPEVEVTLKGVAYPDELNIDHTPLEDTTTPGPRDVCAEVTAIHDVRYVTLFWSKDEGIKWHSLDMANTDGDTYCATIPESKSGQEVIYYIETKDYHNQIVRFPADAPDSVVSYTYRALVLLEITGGEPMHVTMPPNTRPMIVGSVTLKNAGLYSINWAFREQALGFEWTEGPPSTGSPVPPLNLDSVAIFQESNPWNNAWNQNILASNGIPYTVYTKYDLGDVDLSVFDKVIISSSQSSSFYTELETHRKWLEDYVYAGGMLDFHAAYQSGDGAGKVMAGGFVMTSTVANDISILDLEHPIVTTPNAISNTDLNDWDASVHAYFSTVPAGAVEVLSIEETGEPCAIVISHGMGRIFATTQTVEFTNAFYDYLENTILYEITDMPWADESVESGTLLMDEEIEVIFRFNSRGFVDHTYRDGIIYIESPALVDPFEIPVSLRVVGDSIPDPIDNIVAEVSQGSFEIYQYDIESSGLGLYDPSKNQGFRNRDFNNVVMFGTFGNQEAQKYLEDKFTEMGLDVSVQGNYKNVVADLTGTVTPENVYVIGAHFDHTTGDRPGGDDNASGTAALLEAARVLSQFEFESTIRFVAFNAEEDGLLGSKDYVANIPNGDNIIGMVNLDMILRPGSDEAPGRPIDFEVETDGSLNWATAFRYAAEDYVPSIVVGDLINAGRSYSDNDSFHNAGIPALLAIENSDGDWYEFPVANTYYHTYEDASDRLANDPNSPSGITYDYPFATDVTRICVAFLAQEAVPVIVAEDSTIWVDFDFPGEALGTNSNPFVLVDSGVSAVQNSGTINIAPGSSAETLSISKPLTLNAHSGPVRIGE